MEGTSPERLRASDADRERVLAVLREAVADGRLDFEEFQERSDRAAAARRLGDLVGLTTDLVPPEAQPLRLDSGPVAALFGAKRRGGRWVVPSQQWVFSLFGSAELDLRDALLARDRVAVAASAFFGRVVIRVPEGMEVRIRRRSLFGRRAAVHPSPLRHAPVLEVDGVSLFGSVRVSTSRKRRLGRGRPRRELR
ncbi:hypothetical protein TM51_02644 [Thermobifida fusca TM51]|jgi:hypothetical protein|uniref:Cell wall-active antibiotics response LiaF-like C-terminal domain-containing protein n=2 Tax=Thermobifida fusca TaxID=2021 RepID=A0A9P2WSA0_THEFU|nr:MULTISPECIES: DUF1707 domain-containing protein [Thermobifida]EOR72468.1 hypothetical protein TM51_02644 [Thermobifida fusca TM51]MBO2529640.1 hypothetical protein [Thermobifida sp.]MDD6792267.1 DUF1707 domain-containing protein [Thermobifida fusca]PPS92262.1 hypothetical protein BH05_10895 [Thermobifida fusca]PZN63735.1 MAG: DUF1707 and DUF2154 domain-containing protein [Thermobifida fusca]